MDIKDLSVGDWVKSPITNIPYQITGAFITPDVGEIVMLQSNGGEELRCPSESIEPIPITPKILLKNGFKEHIFPEQYKNAEKCTIVRAGKEWDFNSAIEEYRFIGKYQSLYGLQFRSRTSTRFACGRHNKGVYRMMYKLRFAAIVPEEVIDKTVAEHCKRNNLKVVDKQFRISIGGHLRCYTEEWVYLLVSN